VILASLVDGDSGELLTATIPKELYDDASSNSSPLVGERMRGGSAAVHVVVFRVKYLIAPCGLQTLFFAP
jgi:hypothetical protein